MSAALATAPHHPEAQEASRAANKELHFKNGGVLGLTESFARLLKGVTYDAGVDTFGGKHRAAKADHPTPDHPKGKDHPKPAEAKEDHPKAADGKEGGHGDDDGWVEKAAHWAALYAHVPFIEKGVKWAKNKLFPEIHKVTVDYDHIGDQILHKLKADKKALKNKKRVIDHHDLEGFCKGLDTPNLQRQFRMFVELGGGVTADARLQKALKSDSGKKEIEKEIAALFDMTGEVDRSEVEHQTDALLERLGVDDQGHRHPLDSRVDKQHEAMVQVIKNARAWLTPEVLAKVYGTEDKEDDYEMDYKAIGDRILKLNEKTLKPFLNRVKKDGIDDMEIAVGDLLEEANTKSELKHNPDDLREQISNLFNVKGKVTEEKLEERKKQIQAKLKNGTPIDTYTAARDAVIALIEKACTNLIAAGVFDKLYPTEEGTFDWDYEHFGASVLGKVNDKNRKTVLKSFDSDAFDSTFSGIYPSVKSKLLESTDGKKRVKEELKTLFRLGDHFEQSDVVRQKSAILKRLGNGTIEPEKFEQLSVRLETVSASFSPDIEKALFADISAVGPDKFVENFRDLETAEEVAAFIRGYKSSSFRGHFSYLFDEEELDEVIAIGTNEERNEAKREIREFVGLRGGLAKPKYFAIVHKEFVDTQARVDRNDLTSEDQERYDALERDLSEIKTNLTDTRLERLFGGEKIVEIPTSYEKFGKQMRNLKQGEVKGYVMAFQESQFSVHFRYINKRNIINYIGPATDLIKQEIANFTGLEGEVDEEDIRRFVEMAKTKLMATGMGQAREVARNLEDVQNALTRSVLEQVYRK